MSILSRAVGEGGSWGVRSVPGGAGVVEAVWAGMQRRPLRAFSGLTLSFLFFFFQAEDGIRDLTVTGVQTCALPISPPAAAPRHPPSAGARGPAHAPPPRPRAAPAPPASPRRAAGRSSPPASRRGRQIGRASCRERV